MGVVVILKFPQLFFQIAFVPGLSLGQKFPPDGAIESLDKGMKNRQMGNGFDFLDFLNPLMCSPPVIAELEIVVRAEMASSSLLESCLIENLSKRGAIDITSMHTIATDLASELVHDNQDPVCFDKKWIRTI